jgi:hypothetical protein
MLNLIANFLEAAELLASVTFIEMNLLYMSRSEQLLEMGLGSRSKFFLITSVM